MRGTMFGPDKNIAVTLLSKTTELLELHKQLTAIADGLIISCDHPEYVGSGFVPHATVQDTGRLQLGQAYSLDSISLVDMFPGNDITRRAIIENFPFTRITSTHK